MSEPLILRVAPSLAQKLIASLELAHLEDLIEVVMVGAGDELSPAEVASLLGVSASTVRRYEDKGWLVPARRLAGSGYRRYARADVEDFQRRDAAGEFTRDPAPESE